jgi:hypothetical protein
VLTPQAKEGLAGGMINFFFMNFLYPAGHGQVSAKEDSPRQRRSLVLSFKMYIASRMENAGIL